MPIFEETADLDKYPTPDINRNMGGHSTPPEESIPASVSVTPPSTVAAIEAAQNSGITGTPQRSGNPAENESGIFGGNRLPSKTLSPRQPARAAGVDWFGNENVKGFITNTHFQKTDHVEPLREGMDYKDSKGDYSYFQNTPSRKFGGTVSKLLDFRGDAVMPSFSWVGLDRSGFVSMFNENNIFTNGEWDGKSFTIKYDGSRLEDIGTSGFFDGYYSQLFSKSGLGIQSDNHSQNRNLGFSGYLNTQLKKTNFGINQIRQYVLGSPGDSNPLPSFVVPKDREEPFIIRAIGQKWGIDRVPKPEVEGFSAGLVQIDKPPHKGGSVVGSFLNLADDVGRRVLGREPSVFLDRYFADVYRINGATNALDFVVRGSTFVNAQDTLQKRNPFETTTTNMYQIAGAENELTIQSDDYISEPYRQFVPNTTLLSSQLNTRAYNPLSVFSIPGVMHINRNSYIDIGPVTAAGTIADFISQDVWGKITAKTEEVIKDVATSIVTNWAKKKADKLLEDNAPAIKKLEDEGNELKKTAKAKMEAAKKTGEKLRKAAEYFDLIPAQENQNASKAALAKLGQNAFDDLGRDRVNLIPYGKDTYDIGGNETPLDELDWIPFKFKDVRENTFITFRAILSGITDTITTEYTSERYIGRPDNVHVYQGTNREIGFTFDVYPKSDSELVTLWEKLNYLAGLTYPHWSNPDTQGGKGMIAPFTELTIGQMYSGTPGIITGLTYTIQDNGTWETVFAKLPKYIQVSVAFTHIGKRLPSATQKHFELPWVASQKYDTNATKEFLAAMSNPELFGNVGNILSMDIEGRRAEKNKVLQANLDATKKAVDEHDAFTDGILAETGDYEEVEFVE